MHFRLRKARWHSGRWDVRCAIVQLVSIIGSHPSYPGSSPGGGIIVGWCDALGAGFGTLRLVCVQARVVANTRGVFPVHTGTWCSGITSALHAEGPGFNPKCVHLFQRGWGAGR